MTVKDCAGLGQDTILRLETIAEHTLDMDLLKEGDYILDAGCRSYTFANEMARRGYKVMAMDPDPEVFEPAHPNIALTRSALRAVSGPCKLIRTQDPQARYVLPDSHGDQNGITIQQITRGPFHDIGVWGAVKLDVEGSEYDVLECWPGPIARMISIEFHEHCHPAPVHGWYERVLVGYLGNWYRVVQHELTDRHYAGKNYWDTLLVLR